MSGGHFGYIDRNLMDDIFGYIYEEDPKELMLEVRRRNPLEDVEMSELVYDVLDVIHAYDWYASGDTCESDYRKAVSEFKAKWLKTSGKARTKREIDTALDLARDNLYEEFGLKDGEGDNE